MFVAFLVFCYSYVSKCVSFVIDSVHAPVSACTRHGTARHGSSSRWSVGPLGQSYNRSLGARTVLRQVVMHFTTCLWTANCVGVQFFMEIIFSPTWKPLFLWTFDTLQLAVYQCFLMVRPLNKSLPCPLNAMTVRWTDPSNSLRSNYFTLVKAFTFILKLFWIISYYLGRTTVQIHDYGQTPYEFFHKIGSKRT